MTTDITELAHSLKAAAEKAIAEEGSTWWNEEQLASDYGLALHRTDAKFIALASHENVLALVEALEKAQRHANLTEAERQAYLGLISKRDERIAELESNEVREEGNQFLVVRHPGKVPVIKHPVGELEDYLRQILKAAPLATIDIVTHRYYGVGGQFVEDADEYLHEMSIKVEAE
ncbi:TPA: hypothetical protein ACHOYU_000780 [Raoultella planticola]